MKIRPHHFSIGAVSVTLRSPCRTFIDEYRSLYAPYEQIQPAPHAIDVAITPRHRFPWRRGPYSIHGGLAEAWSEFIVPRRFEVLPHLEWFTSWRIINQRTEFLQLHAASMEIDGAGLILPGDPGSGKSTLSAGLLARGWSYLCDEFSLIDPETLTVQPFPRAMCVKEPAFPVIDSLGLPLRRATPYHKPTKGRVAFLDPLKVRSDAVGQASKVRWVVFPKYTAGATPVLIPMTRAAAAYELARQCFNFRSYQARAIDILSDLVRGACCYRLVAGDITATCDVVESLLNREVSRKVG